MHHYQYADGNQGQPLHLHVLIRAAYAAEKSFIAAGGDVVDIYRLGKNTFTLGRSRLPTPVRADPLRLEEGNDRYWLRCADQGMSGL